MPQTYLQTLEYARNTLTSIEISILPFHSQRVHTRFAVNGIGDSVVREFTHCWLEMVWFGVVRRIYPTLW